MILHNKKMIALLASCVVLTLAACSGGGGGGVMAVDSYPDLGECTSTNEGATRLVSDEKQYYRCKDGVWEKTSYPSTPIGNCV